MARVYSAGQVKTVRVESAKASDVEGEGFFFEGMRGGRAMAFPRPAVRVRPPMLEFDDLDAKGELERAVRSFKDAVKRSAESKLQLKEPLMSDLRKFATLRKTA